MLSSGCAEQTLLAQSDRFGFDHSVLRSDGFSHRVLLKAGPGPVEHIYRVADASGWTSAGLLQTLRRKSL